MPNPDDYTPMTDLSQRGFREEFSRAPNIRSPLDECTGPTTAASSRDLSGLKGIAVNDVGDA